MSAADWRALGGVALFLTLGWIFWKMERLTASSTHEMLTGRPIERGTLMYKLVLCGRVVSVGVCIGAATWVALTWIGLI